MVLVDNSVWVTHLRNRGVGLDALLTECRVLFHPFIVGELACGNLRQRFEILSHPERFPKLSRQNMRKSCSSSRIITLCAKVWYVDMHLLASVILTRVSLWTLNKKLNEVAVKLKLAPEELRWQRLILGSGFLGLGLLAGGRRTVNLLLLFPVIVRSLLRRHSSHL